MTEYTDALRINYASLRTGTVAVWNNIEYTGMQSSIDSTCPETIWALYNSSYTYYPGQSDINSALVTAVRGSSAVYDDDGARTLPIAYYRTKEGVERFFITDINNPASGTWGQSIFPIMWDAWSAAQVGGDASNLSGAASFNHIPGGCNVLYMDGHVEFARLNAKFPVLTDLDDVATGSQTPLASATYNNRPFFHYWASQWGGWN